MLSNKIEKSIKIKLNKIYGKSNTTNEANEIISYINKFNKKNKIKIIDITQKLIRQTH